MLSPRVIPPHNLLHPRGSASSNEQEHVLLPGDKISLLPLETIFSLSERLRAFVRKFFTEKIARLALRETNVNFICYFPIETMARP